MIEVAQENEVVIVQNRPTLTDGDVKGLAGCVERTIVGPVVTDLICGTPAFRSLVRGQILVCWSALASYLLGAS